MKHLGALYFNAFNMKILLSVTYNVGQGKELFKNEREKYEEN